MQSLLLDNLLQQNFSGLPARDFLQQLAAEHPYFSPAQFFLLKQLNETDADYAGQAAKTALLFNNPHWLQFKLQQPAGVKTAPVIAMYAENTDNDDDSAELVTVETEVKEEPVIETAVPVKTEEWSVNVPAIDDSNSDNDDDNAILGGVAEVASTETITAEAHSESVIQGSASPATEALTYSDNTDNDDDTAVLLPEENAPMPDMKMDLTASIKNAENENAMAFEPMHLVDYFASQGIKLSEEVQPADKLGKQLKSFTEWLKTMKKVHVPDATAPGGSSEVAIQVLAEKSNTENEVITEAMAEVFAQQGKAAKAIELYQKLSLLNPTKSAYFAAKIENLKGQ